MMAGESPLETALLVNSETLPRWQRDALQQMVTETEATITNVALREEGAREDGLSDHIRTIITRFSEYPLWSVVGIVRTLTPDPAYKQQVPITTIDGVENAEWTYCEPEPADGVGNTLPDAVVASVGADVDVAVRFGFGILKGRILDAPEYGVLSYHLGDIRQYRGRPGGFWEFLAGEDEMGVTVQQLSETLDGGRLVALSHVDISDAATYQEIRRRAIAAARGMLTTSVRRILDSDHTPQGPETTGTLHTLPRGGAVLAYLIKNSRGRIQCLLS